jgi:hypothetical protein
MTAVGQSRRFPPIRTTSAIHPIASKQRTSLDVRKVPTTDITPQRKRPPTEAAYVGLRSNISTVPQPWQRYVFSSGIPPTRGNDRTQLIGRSQRSHLGAGFSSRMIHTLVTHASSRYDPDQNRPLGVETGQYPVAHRNRSERRYCTSRTHIS